MFKKNRLTYFEKLLFAEKYIEELKKQNSALKVEIGKLNSEIAELNYHINFVDKDVVIRSLKDALSKSKKQNKVMKEELKRYRKQNSNKIYEDLKNK